MATKPTTAAATKPAAATTSAPTNPDPTKSQDVAVVDEPKNQVVRSTVDADDFGEYEGAGLQNVTANDVLVPRLTILQALSPQLNERKPEYIEGAKQGHICDVGTGEIFPDGVLFLPAYYYKVFIEWAPRASGQGLVEIHQDPSILDQTTRNDKKQAVLANGNIISETAQFFGFNLTAQGRRSFVPMAGTMLKRAKRWNTLATGEKLQRANGSLFTPPLFYRAYSLTTISESNSQGDWYTWKIERGPTIRELDENQFGEWRALRDEANKFMTEIAKGSVRGDLAPEEDGPVIEGQSSEGRM